MTPPGARQSSRPKRGQFPLHYSIQTLVSLFHGIITSYGRTADSNLRDRFSLSILPAYDVRGKGEGEVFLFFAWKRKKRRWDINFSPAKDSSLRWDL